MFQCAEARSNANWSRRSCHAVALSKLFICLCRVGSVCFQADCITCHQMHFCPQGHLGRRWWQRRIHAHPPISWRRHAMLAPCRRNQWIFCNSKICSLSEYFFFAYRVPRDRQFLAYIIAAPSGWGWLRAGCDLGRWSHSPYATLCCVTQGLLGYHQWVFKPKPSPLNAKQSQITVINSLEWLQIYCK